jgi:hypothetical protein
MITERDMFADGICTSTRSHVFTLAEASAKEEG